MAQQSLPERSNIKQCSVEGCVRQYRAKGYCATHYRLWRNHGDPLLGRPYVRSATGSCSIDGCERPHSGRSFCALHYRRFLETGTPFLIPRHAHNFLDISGQRFHSVVARRVTDFRTRRGEPYWDCECDCGLIFQATSANLRRGRYQSCGCQKGTLAGERRKRHGESSKHGQTAEYRAFSNARNRCNNTNNRSYADYGGRGVEFRFESLEQFLAVLGRRPTPKHSLDRINPDGHYEPNNVRWATPIEQANNKRNNTCLTIDGETKTVAQWAKLVQVSDHRIRRRLGDGWCSSCSVFAPPKSSCSHKV